MKRLTCWWLVVAVVLAFAFCESASAGQARITEFIRIRVVESTLGWDASQAPGMTSYAGMEVAVYGTLLVMDRTEAFRASDLIVVRFTLHDDAGNALYGPVVLCTLQRLEDGSVTQFSTDPFVFSWGPAFYNENLSCYEMSKSTLLDGKEIPGFSASELHEGYYRLCVWPATCERDLSRQTILLADKLIEVTAITQ